MTTAATAALTLITAALLIAGESNAPVEAATPADILARWALAVWAAAILVCAVRIRRRLLKPARRRLLAAQAVLIVPTLLFWVAAAFGLFPFAVLTWLSRVADIAVLILLWLVATTIADSDRAEVAYTARFDRVVEQLAAADDEYRSIDRAGDGGRRRARRSGGLPIPRRDTRPDSQRGGAGRR